MMNRTHALSGGAAWLVGCALLGVPLVDPATVGGMVLCGVAATLPDLDHPNSAPTRRLGLPGRWLAAALCARFGHRGATHWLSTAAAVGFAVGTVTVAVFGWAGWWVGLAVAAGMAIHDLGDAATLGGVPLWGPWSRRRVHIAPRWLRMSVGGPAETYLVFPLLALNALAAIVNLH